MGSVQLCARSLANVFTTLVTPENTRRFEVTIIRLAVLFFVCHLGLLFLLNHVPGLYRGHSFNYLKAIYTPFSFILVYEVFLLVIILPESMTEFIAKQFEIITLITLRSFFHDVASIPMHAPIHASDPAVIGLGYDLLASLAMFSLTVVFHRLHLRNREPDGQVTPLHTFIDLKKSVSVFLIVVLLVTSAFSFVSWAQEAVGALIILPALIPQDQRRFRRFVTRPQWWRVDPHRQHPASIVHCLNFARVVVIRKVLEQARHFIEPGAPVKLTVKEDDIGRQLA
jgi:hypothetical protein